MGRGAQKETRTLADQQLAMQNALNQQLLGERTQVRDLLLPQFQEILRRPGYSEAEKAAVTGQSLGALGSAFDALRQRAENRLARTRNPAGFGELLDELAREQGREAADVTRQNQIDFANEAFRRQMAALQGMGQLFGVDTGLLGRSLGIPAELLNVRANASRGGGFSFGFGPLRFSP
jgi:hypothetical protein